MLKSIRLTNFRGVKEAEVKGFSKFNIFIGRNASGKTTLLEAVSVAANPASPGWLLQLSTSREMVQPSVGSDYALSTYFYDLDLRQLPHISFDTDLGKHEVSIRAFPRQFVSVPKEDSLQDVSATIDSEGLAELGGIKIEYKDAAGKLHQSQAELLPPGHMNISPQGMMAQTVKVTGANIRGLGAFYIHARRSTSVNETAKIITDLYEEKKQDLLINALRGVDSRVSHLQSGVRGNQAVVLVDIGTLKLLPINVLGDGFCRMTLIASGLLNKGSKFLIVDDIDSGLHYSAMRPFWSSLQALGESLDRQIFCSTHNEEMLRYAREAFSSKPDDIAVFRLERNVDDVLHVERYNYEMLETAIESQLELR